MDQDESFMRLALALATEARERDEVPIGAVVALEGRAVGRGANRPIAASDPTAHAEIEALRHACRATGNYRLDGATLYCTVEPCLMCYGAAIHARIARLVYGASDPKVGVTRAWERMVRGGADLNHRIEVHGGVLENECSELLLEFFRRRRETSREGSAAMGSGEVPKWS